MQITNIYFSKIIKLENRLREFNFRKLPNTNNNFHVDVTDDRGQRIMFTMYPDAEHTWHISTTEVPGWIHYAQNILGQLIENKTTSGLNN
jgi:iron only hydrogenase large subunit-like protein